jgi:glyoxylase-like metal-dependent hydrolase (beta-lactamase superfamily II)/8-oxo-dGTP pyrophosphatase MutT (NUDIX family)
MPRGRKPGVAVTGLYEKVLAQLASGASLPAPRPPRASAAVVPWRLGSEGLEVFWVERSSELRFMGGWQAFPGGGLSRSDAGIELAGEPRGLDQGPPDAAIPEWVSGVLELGAVAPRGLVACAVRELFEETGLVPSSGARSASPPAALLDRLAAARTRLLAGEADFGAVVQGAELAVDPTLLTYAGRWLTPPLGPLRFDNRFFLLEWPADAALQPSIRPGELSGGGWVKPARALAAWRAGEVIAAPPILHILRVLEEDGPDRGLDRLRNPVEANLGPHRRIEFRPGVLLFPMATPTLPPARHTNAYVVGHGEAVLIDPGSPYPEEIDALRRALAVLENDPAGRRRVKAIWLTHHHPDHVGAVPALREALGVPVLAHPLTAEHLRGSGIPIDGELVEGQRVTLDGDPPLTLRVLHTPGHARGHLAFFDEGGGSLVVGDVVTGIGTLVIDPPEGDMEDYLATLARLRDLAPRTLFPAHGPTLLGAAARFEAYIDHRRERERRVLAAWRAGARTPATIVPQAYDELDPLAIPLAERQVQAHLDWLERKGELG